MHNHESLGIFLRFSSFICNFLCVVFWVLLIFGFDEPASAGATLLAVMVHEGGHELCLLLRQGEFSKMRGAPLGFKIEASGALSYKDELALLSAGAAANIIFALAALPFSYFSGWQGYAHTLMTVNLATAVSNLIPVRGRDGYGILRTLAERNESEDLMRFADICSFTVSLGLCFLSLYLMQRLGEGYWIFAVFFFSLFCEVSHGLKK